MRVLVLTAVALRLLGAGAPIDPRGPPALPGSRQKAVLRRQVSDEPSGALTKMVIFAMGRFWCAEPVFARLHGVISTEVGYTGGWTTDPTYKEVLHPPEGQPSGHAFAVRVGYDPGHITLKMLLEVFFDAHGEWPLIAGWDVKILSFCASERHPACAADATTINRQGSDVGSQFRSAIFYDPGDLEDKDTCMEAMWEERPNNGRHLVTAMEDRSVFYRAEE
jgi:peptide-methionine (S)-S-oxide reductase